MGEDKNRDAEPRHLTEEGIVFVPGLASRWVRLPNGERAHYMTAGETGPAVILLHGGLEGSSGTAGWRFMATVLGANGFRVYAPDRPGYGLADTSKVEYLNVDRRAQVEFVRMFADSLCLDKFHLSGNSMGCLVSCDFVTTYPERVLSVAFIAGVLGDLTPGLKVPPAQGKFTPNPAFSMTPWDLTEDGMRAQMESIIYESSAIWPELITMRTTAALEQRRAREAAGMTPFVLAMQREGDMAVSFSTRDRLGRMQVPMIYMYGLQDVLFPVENGFDQEDAIANIQFFYPDECGHQGQTDQPDLFNQVFLEFFRDGKVSWPTAQRAGVSRRRAIDPRFVEEPAGGFPAPVPEAYTDIETLRQALRAPAPAA